MSKDEGAAKPSEHAGAANLTHLDASGRAQMVDVGQKGETERLARAGATLRMAPETLRTLQQAGTKKGDVLAVARVAAIQAAKRTWELIPLCHQIALTSVEVQFEPDADGERLHVEATARCRDRTGVEMEALTAVSVAALTVYDMLKAVDRAMVIENTRLLEKTGGRSGHYVAP